ncbi:MAG: F0F1 ATP synthase subunit delta [Legionellales bacterium]|jgi:F-type H+-transporting ATPase subunit delta
MSSTLTLARPYAKAAYLAAKDTQEVALWSAALEQLAQWVNVKEIETIIKNPLIDKETVVTFLMQCAKINNPQIKNFLTLLAEYTRLPLLKDIFVIFTALHHDDEKIMNAQFIAPFPVSDANAEKIKTRLEQRFKRKIKLTTHVDPTLIGGGVVKIGDQVIDGSLKSKLNDLSKYLLTVEGT